MPTSPTDRPLPLLLLPGTACDERLFGPLMQRFAHPDMRVLPLTGLSTTPEMAARLLETAPDRFDLLGFSLGGIVALEMVAQAPHRIARLALLDTTARPDPEANHAVRHAAVERARAHGMAGYILDAWPRLVSPANAADRALQQLIVDMAVAAGPDVLASQSGLAIHRADSRPRLAEIACPTLVLAGADEAVCPLAVQHELAAGIPGARFFTIPQAGHFAPLENPGSVARHVRGWLGLENPNPAETANTKEPS